MPSSLPASFLMSVACSASEGHAAFAERHSRSRRRAPHLPPRCALRASARLVAGGCPLAPLVNNPPVRFPHRLGSSSSSTALRTLVRSDEPRVGPLPAGRRRLHPPSRTKHRHTTTRRKLLTRSGTNHPVFSPSTCLIERRGAALIQRTETSKPFLRNGVFCFLYRCGPCPLWRAFRQDRWARSIAIFKQP